MTLRENIVALLATLSTTALLVLLSSVRFPLGFQANVLFDPAIASLFLLVVALLAFLSLVRSATIVSAATAVLLFSVLYLGIWVVSVPGGYMLTGDTPPNVAVVSTIISLSHIPNDLTGIIGSLEYPGIFVLGAVAKQIGGLGLSQTLYLLDLVQILCWGLFSLLILRIFFKSVKQITLGVLLFIVGTAQLFKWPLYGPQAYGFTFFLVAIFLLMRSSHRLDSRIGICYGLAFVSAAVTYPLASFMLVLIVAMSAMGDKSGRFGRKLPGRSISPLAPESLIVFSTLVFLVWTVYVGYQVVLNGSRLPIEFIFNSLFQSGTGTSTGPNASYLVQLLNLSAAFAPPYTSLLLPFWFVFLFGAGFMVWFGLRMTKTITSLPSASVVVPGFIVMFILTFSGGVTEWFRVTPFVGLFLSVTLVWLLGRLGGSRLITLVVILALMATLPTIVSYSPEIGTGGAHYPQSFAAAAFTERNYGSAQILVYGDLPTFNATLRSQMLPIPSDFASLALTQSGFIGQLSNFEQNKQNSLLVIDPLFFASLAQGLGTKSNAIQQEAEGFVQTSNLVYSNGLTSLVD